MLRDEELQDFRNLRFVLECQEIRLRQLGTKKPRVLRGPGKICQKADGRLHFEAYVRKGALADTQVDPLGEVLPRTRYYSLKATDWQGREWKCAQVHPSVRRWAPGRFMVVTGELRLLKGIEYETVPRAISHSVTGYVFSGDVSVPANQRTTYRRTRGTGSWSEGGAWDVAKFEIGDAQIHFEHDPDRMLVRASRKGGRFPASYGQKMLESLRFVTGALASWSVLIAAGPESTEVNLYRLDRRAAGVRPPIAKNTTVSAKATEDMFRGYLNYVLTEKRPFWFHRLSAEWGEVLRASRGTLQTQATIWCTVVEALLKLVISSRRLGPIADPKEKARVRVWRARVLRHLEEKKCPQKILDRFRGVTDRMLQPSPREVMKKLEAVGAMDVKLGKRWGNLRHPSAHADRERQGPEDALFRECMAVLALLYQLSFYLIDYKGWFSDYAAKGWPVRKYPLK